MIKFARTSLALSVLFLPWMVFGCSLTSVADIRVGECKTDEGCREVLNPKNGFYADCAAFRCVDTGEFKQCQRVEEEICDGLDNDCDHLVDEPAEATPSEPLLKLSQTVMASGIPDVQRATSAVSDELSRIYLQDAREPTVRAVDVDSGEAPLVTPMTQKNPDGLTEDGFIELTEGCFHPTSDWGTLCNLKQTVTTADDSVGYYAQLNVQGCRNGELHVGVIDPDEPTEFIDRGRAFRSASYRGVATKGSRCTANGTAECTDAKQRYLDGNADVSEVIDRCGVSRPSIGAIKDQALVSYLGRGVDETQCGQEDPAKLFAILIHSRSGNSDGNFIWGETSGEGAPAEIGITRGSTGASVEGVEDAGFVVAHGDGAGRVRLVWLPKQESPPGSSGTQCEGDCDARQESRRTEPLVGLEELTSLGSSGSGPIDGVELRFHPLRQENSNSSPTEGILAVTWVEGCIHDSSTFVGPGKAQLLRLDLSTNPPTIKEAYPEVSLGDTRSAPIASPTDRVFVTDGISRGDKSPSELDRGGFYILTRNRTVSARRLAFFDGLPVEEEEVFRFASATDNALLGLKDGAFLIHNEGNGDLTTASFLCEQ